MTAPSDAAARVEEPRITLTRVTPDDAGEVLTVQRAAFVSEALIYGSVDMPPLTQTLDQVRAEYRAQLRGAVGDLPDDELAALVRATETLQHLIDAVQEARP